MKKMITRRAVGLGEIPEPLLRAHGAQHERRLPAAALLLRLRLERAQAGAAAAAGTFEGKERREAHLDAVRCRGGADLAGRQPFFGERTPLL